MKHLTAKNLAAKLRKAGVPVLDVMEPCETLHLDGEIRVDKTTWVQIPGCCGPHFVVKEHSSGTLDFFPAPSLKTLLSMLPRKAATRG